MFLEKGMSEEETGRGGDSLAVYSLYRPFPFSVLFSILTINFMFKLWAMEVERRQQEQQLVQHNIYF